MTKNNHGTKWRDAVKAAHARQDMRGERDALEAFYEAASDHMEMAEYVRLAETHYYLDNAPRALEILEIADGRWPDEYNILKGLAAANFQQGRTGEALIWAEKAFALYPDSRELLSLLAMIHGQTGNRSKAREFGQKALIAKDKEVCGQTKVSGTLPPAKSFNPETPERNVIAFSLWGKDARYLDGAITNASLIPHLMPEWRGRFYCTRDLPEAAIETLVGHGADVILMPVEKNLWHGLFWRFYVANDPGIDRFLVRDVDGLISLKERASVLEWVAGDKLFHLMRDNYGHMDLLMAGLWGGTTGVLPPLRPQIDQFLDSRADIKPNDQHFLEQYVWPVAKKSITIHDEHFGCFEALDFPDHPPRPLSGNIGTYGRDRARLPRGTVTSFSVS